MKGLSIMFKGIVSRLTKIHYYIAFRMMVFFVICLLLGAYVPLLSSHRVNQNPLPLNFTEGQILYSPMGGTSTFLIENTGTVNHTWSSDYNPGLMTRWLGDGTILRTIRAMGPGPGTGGGGGGVQIVNWDGTVEWDFRYNSNGVLSHHDVRSLPNGN